MLLEPFKRAAGLMAVQKAAGGHIGDFDLVLTVLGLKPAPHGQIPQLIFTEPLEFFFTKVKLAMFGAIVLTFPILAFQLYRFVAPGLYKRERRAFLPFLIASPVLFTLGRGAGPFHHAAVRPLVRVEPADHRRRLYIGSASAQGV